MTPPFARSAQRLHVDAEARVPQPAAARLSTCFRTTGSGATPAAVALAACDGATQRDILPAAPCLLVDLSLSSRITASSNGAELQRRGPPSRR